MLHSYGTVDAAACLKGQTVVFIGDSTVRQVFEGMAQILEPALPQRVDSERHADRLLVTSGVRLEFVWDPYLNGSRTAGILAGDFAGAARPPALLVLSAGLWHLRRLGLDDGQAQWDAAMERVSTSANSRNPISDQVVLMPIERALPSRLSAERLGTLREADIDRLNHAIDQRLSSTSSNLAVARVFNALITNAESETSDGLHFSNRIIRTQANILLNLRCNGVAPQRFPFDRTCCFRYPTPNVVQVSLLVILLLWAPVAVRFFSTSSSATLASLVPPQDKVLSLVILASSVFLIYLADRSSFFLKAQKQFETFDFALLSLAALGAGLLTMKPAEKDLGFLNRDQTDEWKGWMQIAILIYHYYGASQIVRHPFRSNLCFRLTYSYCSREFIIR